MRTSYVERVAEVVYYGIWLLALSIVLPWLFEKATGTLLFSDSTDSVTERSGLALRIDYGTGCQYLESAHGGVTPRLMSDGKQMCIARRP